MSVLVCRRCGAVYDDFGRAFECPHRLDRVVLGVFVFAVGLLVATVGTAAVFMLTVMT